MDSQDKACARVAAHVISAATWIWALIQLVATGNWGAFWKQASYGVAGHVATEIVLG